MDFFQPYFESSSESDVSELSELNRPRRYRSSTQFPRTRQQLKEILRSRVPHQRDRVDKVGARRKTEILETKTKQVCLAPKLFAHQLRPAVYLERRMLNFGRTAADRKIMLYMEMGSGKSAAMAECLMRLPCTSFVVVPAAVALNMQGELLACGLTQLKGRPRSMRAHFETERGQTVYLLTHDSLPRVAEEQPRLFHDPFALVYDESQFLRNVGSFSRTVVAVELADRADFLILMTGTPMHTRVADLFPQLFAMGAVYPSMMRYRGDEDVELTSTCAQDFQTIVLRDPVAFFRKLKRQSHQIFYHKNYTVQDLFARFVDVPTHMVPATVNMQLLYDSPSNSAKAMAMLKRVRANKNKSNKQLSGGEILFMSSNIDFSDSFSLRAAPKSLRMCEFILSLPASKLPVIVLSEKVKDNLGGVERITQTFDSVVRQSAKQKTANDERARNLRQRLQEQESKMHKAETDKKAAQDIFDELERALPRKANAKPFNLSSTVERQRGNLKWNARVTRIAGDRVDLAPATRRDGKHYENNVLVADAKKLREQRTNARKDLNAATKILIRLQTQRLKIERQLATVDRMGSVNPNLRIRKLIGESDQAAVLSEFAAGKIDVIVTTLTEGYSLSCKLPGSKDSYLQGCKPIRQVHFSAPTTSLGDRLQFQARGNRMLSHHMASLAPDQRFIEVHTWATQPPRDSLSSMTYDLHNLQVQNQRQNEIQKVEHAIQQVFSH